MPEIISIFQHPSNTDRTAVLMSGTVYKGLDVYRVSGGYVALLGNDRCFAGLFPTQAAAEDAQRTHVKKNTALPGSSPRRDGVSA